MDDFCSAHSGICKDQIANDRRMSISEARILTSERTTVKMKLFYVLITILIVIFGGIIGLGMTLNTTVNGIENQMIIQGVEMKYIKENMQEMKFIVRNYNTAVTPVITPITPRVLRTTP